MPNPQSRIIGLLGGSFNPAHAGHLHISREALRRLELDAVWWVVSPQNPLKTTVDMADFATRLAYAKQLTAKEPRIHITDIEQNLGTRYTADTLDALSALYPRTTFIWLMGADNLAGFHQWQRYKNILRHYRMAVFDRAPFSHSALHSPTALLAKPYRLPETAVMMLKDADPPAWVYLPIRRHSLSATEIRRNR